MTIDATSSELDDVFSRDSGGDTAPPAASEGPVRDEMGRFAPKSPDPAPKAEEQAAAPEAPPAAPPVNEATPVETPSRHVPLSELLAERQKRKSLQEEADRRSQELATKYQTLEQQFQQLQAQLQQRQAPPQQEQPQLDWFGNPVEAAQTFQQQVQAQFQQQLLNERANFSEARARDKFGDDAVNAAVKAAQAQGLVHGQFLRYADPYGELMKWHKQTSFLSRVGTDPDAYEKQLREQAYQQALADLRSGKVVPPANGNAPQAAPAQARFPTSLATATPAGNQGAMLTDEAALSDLFHPERNRRAM